MSQQPIDQPMRTYCPNDIPNANVSRRELLNRHVGPQTRVSLLLPNYLSVTKDSCTAYQPDNKQQALSRVGSSSNIITEQWVISLYHLRFGYIRTHICQEIRPCLWPHVNCKFTVLFDSIISLFISMVLISVLTSLMRYPVTWVQRSNITSTLIK